MIDSVALHGNELSIELRATIIRCLLLDESKSSNFKATELLLDWLVNGIAPDQVSLLQELQGLEEFQVKNQRLAALLSRLGVKYDTACLFPKPVDAPMLLLVCFYRYLMEIAAILGGSQLDLRKLDWKTAIDATIAGIGHHLEHSTLESEAELTKIRLIINQSVERAQLPTSDGIWEDLELALTILKSVTLDNASHEITARRHEVTCDQTQQLTEHSNRPLGFDVQFQLFATLLLVLQVGHYQGSLKIYNDCLEWYLACILEFIYQFALFASSELRVFNKLNTKQKKTWGYNIVTFVVSATVAIPSIATLASLGNFDSRFYLAFGTSLLIWEAFFAFRFKSVDWEKFGHGFVGAVTGYGCIDYTSAYVIYVFGLMDITNLFAVANWFLDKFELTGSDLQWYNSNLYLATFVCMRLLNPFILVSAIWYKQLKLSLKFALIVVFTQIYLLLLNLKWFKMLIVSIRSRFAGKVAQPNVVQGITVLSSFILFVYLTAVYSRYFGLIGQIVFLLNLTLVITDCTGIAKPVGNTATKIAKNQTKCNDIDTILRVWSEILKVNRNKLNGTSNFFHLGGDSIKAIHMVKSLEKVGVFIYPRDLYLYQTAERIVSVAQFQKNSKEPLPFKLNEKICKEILEDITPFVNLTDIVDVFPATNLQANMYYSALNGSKRSIESLYFKIGSMAAVEKLMQVWSALVEKHSILRTTFGRDASGQAYNIVLKARTLTYSTSSKPLGEFLVEDENRGFEKETLQWFRMALVGNIQDGFYFVLTFHHLIYDGWTLALLMTDFDDLYQNRQLNPSIEFRKYVDYVWNMDLDHARIVWSEYLKDVQPFPSLSVQVHDVHLTYGDEIKLFKDEADYLQLHLDLPIGIESFSKLFENTNATAATVCKLAWAITLQTFYGTNDVVFTEIVSGRNIDLDGVDRITGPCVSPIPCRVNLSGPDLFSILAGIQEDHVKLSQFVAVGLQTIQKWIKAREISKTLFVYQNNIMAEPSPGTPIPENYRDIVQIQKRQDYNLEVSITGADGMTKIALNADPAVLTLHSARSILNSFAIILKDIIEKCTGNLNCPISQINRLSATETEALLGIGRGSQINVPYECAHHAFELNAQLYPNDIAVEHYNQTISYQELDQRAGRLAANLMLKGVRVGDFVVILTVRSIEMIVGILAVLKAGAAYVPIDAGIPTKRIQYIIDTVHPKVVLYHESVNLTGHLQSCTSYECLSLNDLAHHPLSYSKENRATKSDPAYCIFTSGSTGNPKGVIVTHRGLASFATVGCEFYKLKRGTRLGQMASIMFDVCVSDIFCSLSNGSRLVLREEDCFSICRMVEVAELTPSALMKLNPEDCTHLKRLIMGGEVCQQSLIAKWSPYLTIINSYGPTEATVTTSASIQNQASSVNIGKPVTNSFQYIVDENLQLVPLGVPGELLIGGAGVALGYLKNETKTAESFVVNHFLGDGSLMYRTGDICRWTNDGHLEFLGRKDDMVKVKGYRIELEEVSAAVCKDRNVTACTVLVRNDTLVAYLTPKSVDIDGVRETVSRILPYYMAPAIYVALETFPMNSNGKIDKKCLSEMELPNFTETRILSLDERRIAQCFVNVLKLDAECINSESDFFGCGGDSMSATILVQTLKESNYFCQLKDVYECRTVKRLANTISHRLKLIEPLRFRSHPIVVESEISNLVRLHAFKLWQIDSFGDAHIFPLTAIQKNMISNGKSRVALRMIWEIESLDLGQKMYEAWKRVIQKHLCLGLRFVETQLGIYQIQGIEYTGELELFSMPLEEFLVKDGGKDWAINSGHLLKMFVVEDSKLHFVLSLSHLLYDGWSLYPILQDFKLSMNGRLPSNVIEFKPFVDYISASDMGMTNEFYSEYFKTFDCSVKLKESLQKEFLLQSSIPTYRLRAAARQYSTTVAVLLKVAWGLVLQRLCKTNESIVAEIISNRHLQLSGLSEVTGCLFSLAPYRIQRLDYAEHIREIEEQYLTALNHHNISFEIMEPWFGGKLPVNFGIINIHTYETFDTNDAHINPRFPKDEYIEECNELEVAFEQEQMVFTVTAPEPRQAALLLDEILLDIIEKVDLKTM